LPQAVIDAIIVHPDPQVGRLFSRNAAVDPRQVGRLLDGPHSRAAEWLAWRRPDGQSLPDAIISRLLAMAMEYASELMTREEFLSELTFSQQLRIVPVACTHPDPRVRAWACGMAWIVLPQSWRQTLLHDPDEIVRGAANEVVAYEQEMLEPKDLPPHPCHALWHILLHRRLSRTLVEYVLARGQTDEVSCLAYNASTPADVVAALMSHPAAHVRERLAARTDLSSDQLQRLANDPDKTVRTTASINPALNVGWLVDGDIEVSDGNDVRWRPLPWHVEPLCSLRNAASPNPLVRREAARDDRLATETMHRLADDADLGVRVLVCLHHPQAPGDALLRAYLEYSGRDRSRLAAHANFPVTMLSHLADHADPLVRRLLTRDAEADPELIDRLTRDSDLVVRQAAASCPRLPAHRIHELLHDPELGRYAAANPALTVDAMLELLHKTGISLE
jgi:hypothetical protein